MTLLLISLAVIAFAGIFASRILGGKPSLIGKLLLGFAMSVAVSYYVNASDSKPTPTSKKDLVETLSKVTGMNNAPMQMFADLVTPKQTYPMESVALANIAQNDTLKATTVTPIKGSTLPRGQPPGPFDSS